MADPGYNKTVFSRVIIGDRGEFSVNPLMLLFLYEVDGIRSAEEIAGELKFTQSMLNDVIAALLQLDLITLPKSDSYLSDDFLNQLQYQLSLAVGPLADILIEDAIDELGFERTEFPVQSVDKLVDLLSMEIKREEKRVIFQKGVGRLTLG